jgi:hypothetical protein
MLNHYRLELWNGTNVTINSTNYAPNSYKYALLDTIDLASVQVQESLTGGHTLDFRLSYDDPCLQYLAAYSYIRLVDLRSDILTDTITSAGVESTGSIGSSASFITNLAVSDLVTVHLASQTYRTTVTSINTGSNLFYGSRKGGVVIGTDSDHTGRSIERSDYKLYRVKQIEYLRDQQGLLTVQASCQHFSYDLANFPLVVNNRTDLAFSQNQLGGSRPEWERTGSQIMDDLLAPFSNSFAVGQVDFTGKKEISFHNDTALSAIRQVGPAWEGDTFVNQDGLVDLLFFKGTHSGMSAIYGRNLESLQKTEDASGLATSVYPIGASSAWDQTYTGYTATAYGADMSGSLGGRQTSRDMLRLDLTNQANKFRTGDVITVFNDVWDTYPSSTDSTGLVVTLDNTKAGGGTYSWAGLKSGSYRGGILFVADSTLDSDIGQFRHIIDNSGVTVTLDRPFDSDLLSSDRVYVVRNPEITEVLGFGYVTADVVSATTTTLTAGSGTFDATNSHQTGYVEIVAGTGVGQVRRIATNTTTTLTLTATTSWGTNPDSTSKFIAYTGPSGYSDYMQISKLKNIPSNISYEDAGLTGGLLLNGLTHQIFILKNDTEEPLTIGKSYNYRSQHAVWYTPTGTNSLTDPTTFSLVTPSQSSRFENVGRIRVWENLVNQFGIPQKCSLEIQINSIDSSNNTIICNNRPFNRSKITTYLGGSDDDYTPAGYASVEAVTFKSQSDIDQYGDVIKYLPLEEIHRPDDLASQALKFLSKASATKTKYSVNLAELYQLDPIKYSTEKAEVGDLFDVYDDYSVSATQPVDMIETLTILTAREYQTFNVAALSGGMTALSAAGTSYGLFDNQLRGCRLGFVVGANAALNYVQIKKWYAIKANTDTSIIIDEIDTGIDSWYGGGTDTNPAAGFVVFDSLRIIEKTWNPFDADALRIEVSNADNFGLSLAQQQLDQVQKNKATQTQTNNANIQPKAPMCVHFSENERRCVRGSPPNWFCQSSSSNKDGRLTSNLIPITKAHCKGFSLSVDSGVGTETKVTSFVVTVPYDASATNPSTTTTVTVDLPIKINSEEQVDFVPISLTQDPGGGGEKQKPAKGLKYRIKTTGLEDLKPADPVKLTGVEIELWQIDVNTSTHEAYFKVGLSGSGSDYYYDS